MTTVVWDGKTLAADGRCTAGNIIAGESMDKIKVDVHSEVRGSTVIAYALAGAADMFDRVGKWIEEGCPVTDEFKECNFETVIVTEDSAFMYCSESNDLFEIPGSQCLGSGHDFAVSALALGRSAIKSVQHAASIDLFTGGTGTYINCRTKKLVLKKFEV